MKRLFLSLAAALLLAGAVSAQVPGPLPDMPESFARRFANADAGRLETFRRHAVSGPALSPEEFAKVKPSDDYGEYLQAYDYARAVGQQGRLSIPLDTRVKYNKRNLVQKTYNEAGQKLADGELAILTNMQNSLRSGKINRAIFDRMRQQWVDNVKILDLESCEQHVPTTEETFQGSTYTDLYDVRRQMRTRNGEMYFERIDPDNIYIDDTGKRRDYKTESEDRLEMARIEINARLKMAEAEVEVQRRTAEAATQLKMAEAEFKAATRHGVVPTGVPSPKTKQEYDKLPPGTTYRCPDGTLRIKQ